MPESNKKSRPIRVDFYNTSEIRPDGKVKLQSVIVRQPNLAAAVAEVEATTGNRAVEAKRFYGSLPRGRRPLIFVGVPIARAEAPKEEPVRPKTRKPRTLAEVVAESEPELIDSRGRGAETIMAMVEETAAIDAQATQDVVTILFGNTDDDETRASTAPVWSDTIVAAIVSETSLEDEILALSTPVTAGEIPANEYPSGVDDFLTGTNRATKGSDKAVAVIDDIIETQEEAEPLDSQFTVLGHLHTPVESSPDSQFTVLGHLHTPVESSTFDLSRYMGIDLSRYMESAPVVSVQYEACPDCGEDHKDKRFDAEELEAIAEVAAEAETFKACDCEYCCIERASINRPRPEALDKPSFIERLGMKVGDFLGRIFG